MSLSKLEALAEEAVRERRTYTWPMSPEPLSRTLARLQTDVSTFGRILIQPLPEAVHQYAGEPLNAITDTRLACTHSSVYQALLAAS